MSNFLDIAKPLAERGFRVFPLIPKDKRPVKMAEGDHFDAATTDLEQIEQWSSQEPRANVGLSPDEIFCYVETDSEPELKEATADLPPEVWNTTRVSSGRPGRAYYIYRQTARTRKAGNITITREGKDNLLEFKQHRVLVVGPGSTHPMTNPETGQRYVYTAEWKPIPAMPDVLLNRLLELDGKPGATSSNAMSAEAQRQTKLLESFLETYEVATLGDWFNKGKTWYLPIQCPWRDEHENPHEGDSTCVYYVEGGGYGFDCKHRCASKEWPDFKAHMKSRFPGRKFSFQTDPTPVLGTTVTAPVTPVEVPKDWRSKYHSFQDVNEAPEPTFLIEGFLQEDVVTALAAPVGQRKSIIALNVIHACCTGNSLFGHFTVTKKPDRVLYLVPEMGLLAVAKRVRLIGLMPHVGKTLFIRTMNSEGRLFLRDLTPEEVRGALVVIDTATRFIEGDENSSEHMKQFSEECFGLMKAKPAAALVLYHSGKETKTAGELSLENAMRGSGELGAAVSSCWATRLQDPSPDASWETPSYLCNVKQRDFESKAFEATSGPDYRMQFVAGSEGAKIVLRTPGAKADADGKQAEADAVIRRHIGMSGPQLVLELEKAGITRKKSWVCARKTFLIEQDYAQMQKTVKALKRRPRPRPDGFHSVRPL